MKIKKLAIFFVILFLNSMLLNAQSKRVVVLTFDDAVQSHLTNVAPLLKEKEFGATFFVTHRWMGDEHFMTFEEISKLHHMGFEIGNHTWTHGGLSTPKAVHRLASELGLMEYELQRVGVPRPVSFAYPGNGFGPEAVQKLALLGYRFARRGKQPEVPYGELRSGALYDPAIHHPLLIPSTADAYPDWTFEHFKQAVEQAEEGKIVVLQFHGVPDPVHPWVNTPLERFKTFMDYLDDHDFTVIALRDLETYLPDRQWPADPMLQVRYPEKDERLPLPVEMQANRADMVYWLENMIGYHGFGWSEAAQAFGMGENELKKAANEQGIEDFQKADIDENDPIRVLPYPGGRHPRIGFLDGAIDPQRGTKASIFLPWEPSSYIVVDLPEAIFSNLGLTYLAHTHIPTIWNLQNRWLENRDWQRDEEGILRNEFTLPNKIKFGAEIKADNERVKMELWLFNGTDEKLTDLRTQICIMLKGAAEFDALSNENKMYQSPVAAVKAETGDRWIITAWEHCGRAWGNADVPCVHADPVLADCAPGETVRVKGIIRFYQGTDIEEQIQFISKIKE